MRYAVVFLALSLVCVIHTATSSALVVRLLAASFALAFGGVGLAYACIGPRAFLKKSNGQLSTASMIIYWPFHALNWLSWQLFRRSTRENDFDQIEHNLCLGCRLGQADKPVIAKLGLKSVLD